MNDLFATFSDRALAEPASDAQPAASAADTSGATPEQPSDFDLPGDHAVDRQHDVPQRCVVPGCNDPGKHKLGVRCRVWHEPSPIAGKSKTSALWAPDANAFLCDQHALGGAHITLIFEPNDSGETAVKVIGAPHADDRRTPIRHEPRGSRQTEAPAEAEPTASGSDETHPQSTS